MLGRTDTRTRERIRQTIRTVRDISRDDQARIATCNNLRTPTDRLKENYLLLHLRSPRDCLSCRLPSCRLPFVRVVHVLDRKNRRLCSRPHSHESVIFFEFLGFIFFKLWRVW